VDQQTDAANGQNDSLPPRYIPESFYHGFRAGRVANPSYNKAFSLLQVALA
jgi:hypothetical protein